MIKSTICQCLSEVLICHSIKAVLMQGICPLLHFLRKIIICIFNGNFSKDKKTI